MDATSATLRAPLVGTGHSLVDLERAEPLDE